MQTRRRYLALAAAAGATLAGCRTRGGGTVTDRVTTTDATPTEPETHTRTDTETDGPWTPTWAQSLDADLVRGLAPLGDRVVASFSRDDDTSGVAALDADDGTVRWTESFDGQLEAGNGTDTTGRGDARAVAVGPETLYSVHGFESAFGPSRLHALDRADGTPRWQRERERELVVAAASADAVVVTATEYFEGGPNQAPSSSWTETVALDPQTGDRRWGVSVNFLVDVAVGPDTCYLLSETALHAVDVATGETRWVESVDSQPYAGTVLTAGGDVRLVVSLLRPAASGSADTTCVAYDPSGTERWRRTVQARDALAADDRLYLGGDTLTALAADGSVAWTREAGGRQLVFGSERDRLLVRVSDGAVDGAAAYALPGGERGAHFLTGVENAWPEAASADSMVLEGLTEDEQGHVTRALWRVALADGTQTGYRQDGGLWSVRAGPDRYYVATGDSVQALPA